MTPSQDPERKAAIKLAVVVICFLASLAVFWWALSDL
jgi:DNA-binding transcriptional regulator of glucitol operon